MHRSGTSATTRLLSLAGCGLPRDLVPADDHNARGYFEPWRVAVFNSERLRASGGAWDDPFGFPYRPLPDDEAWRARAAGLLSSQFDLESAPLIKDQQVLELTASSTHLAWVISDTDRQANPNADPDEGCTDTKYHGCSLYVMRIGTNQAIRIKLHSYSAAAKLTPTLLGWGGSSSSGDTGEYVMDLSSGEIWRVGAARGCSQVFLAGAYASWSTADENGQCGGQLIVRWRTPK